MLIYNPLYSTDTKAEKNALERGRSPPYCCTSISVVNRCLIKNAVIPDELYQFERDNVYETKCHSCDNLVLSSESSFHLKQINKEAFKERFHINCLVCSKCSNILSETDKRCWIKNGKVVCDDCKKKFTHCPRCNVLVSSDAWVHRLNDYPFHISCFTCCICSRQLTKGEKCGLIEDRLFCQEHFMEICNGKTDNSSDSGSKNKLKRIRTSFTPEQLAILQAHFDNECNPDGQELEKIANNAQLNKRVTQVWFQNARARKKKSGKGCLSSSNINNGSMRYSTALCTDTNSNNGFVESAPDDEKLSSDSSSCTSTTISGFRFNDSTYNQYQIQYGGINKLDKEKQTDYQKISHNNNNISEGMYTPVNNVWSNDFIQLFQHRRVNSQFE